MMFDIKDVNVYGLDKACLDRDSKGYDIYNLAMITVVCTIEASLSFWDRILVEKIGIFNPYGGFNTRSTKEKGRINRCMFDYHELRWVYHDFPFKNVSFDLFKKWIETLPHSYLICDKIDYSIAYDGIGKELYENL